MIILNSSGTGIDFCLFRENSVAIFVKWTEAVINLYTLLVAYYVLYSDFVISCLLNVNSSSLLLIHLCSVSEMHC